MSISFFPQLYPDELVYSALARYYAWSGLPSTNVLNNDLFIRNNTSPSIEYISPMTEEAVSLLIGSNDIYWLILNHTMYPYHSKFLPKEQKKKALSAISDTHGFYNNYLASPKNKTERLSYLRYCPICAEKDRTAYGETYWHRIHQTARMPVCPVHGCRLYDSTANALGRNKTHILYPAEEMAVETGITMVSPVEIDFARYFEKVVTTDSNSEYPVHQFLSDYFKGTEYASVSGKCLYTEKIFKTLEEYYSHTILAKFNSPSRLSAILKGSRINTLEVCEIGYYLDISPELLSCPRPINHDSIEQFYDEIRYMVNNGQTKREIAERFHISPDTIREICIDPDHTEKIKNNIIPYRKIWLKALEDYPGYTLRQLRDLRGIGSKVRFLRKYDREWTDLHHPVVLPKTRKTFYDWTTLDKESLSLVKKVIAGMLSSEERPQRITKTAVFKKAGLPYNGIAKMPLCSNEIQRNEESTERFFARVINWTVKAIERDHKPLNRTQIIRYSNIHKDNLIRCVPFLEKKIASIIMNDNS